jgi:1-acyl-sn-glycerol-3-phosphate acyltransferase
MNQASSLRAAIKAPLLALLIFTAIFILASLTFLGISRANARTRLYRICMALTGMRLKTEGSFSPTPLLLVSNHCSYIDVIMLGSRYDIAFTPKSDVRSWPVIGALVALFGAVFVERNPRKAKEVQAQIYTELRSNRPVSLFPEGTTNDGRHLLPFKPSIFNLAETWDAPETLHIQPVSIRYDALNGAPLEGSAWDNIAWYGEMDFFPHLWQFLKQKRLDATIIFHPELPIAEGKQDRKQLAASAHTAVAAGLNLQHTLAHHDAAA